MADHRFELAHGKGLEQEGQLPAAGGNHFHRLVMVVNIAQMVQGSVAQDRPQNPLLQYPGF